MSKRFVFSLTFTRSGLLSAGALLSSVPGVAFASSSLPQLDASTYASQIFWLCVSFLVLFFVVSRVAIPRISGILQNRVRRIDADLSAARKYRREVETSAAEVDESLEKSRQEAQEYLSTKHQSQQEFFNKKLSEQMQKITVAINEGESNIAERRRDALSELDSIATELVEKCVVMAGGKKPTKTAMKSALKL